MKSAAIFMALLLCALDNVHGAKTVLKNNDYIIKLAPNGAIDVHVRGMPARRFVPEFTVLWSENDPKALHNFNHPNYPVASRSAVRWGVNNETLESLNAWVGSDEYKKTMKLVGVVTGEPSERMWEFRRRDGSLRTRVSGRYGADTSRPFHVAQNIKIRPKRSRIRNGALVWDYPVQEKFTFSAQLTLPDGHGDPKITFSITPSGEGYVSVAFTGAPEVPLETVHRLPQVTEKNLLRNYMMAEADLRLPRVHVANTEGNVALVADQSECRFRLPSFEDSRFGLMVQVENGQVKPVLFAPILGGRESRMQKGHAWGFSFHWVVRSGDWKETYVHIAKELCNFRNRRDNSGPGSLNGTLERVIDYLTDANGHNYAMWDPEQKYYDYFTDKTGVYKPFSPLYGLSAAIVTDDENFFRERVLPNVEFSLSRKYNLFSPFDQVDTGQAVSAARNLGAPYVSYAQLVALHEIFGRRTPALRALAETKRPSASSISDQLAVWRLNGNESALETAKAVASRIERPNRIMSEAQFFDLLELAEATEEEQHVDLLRNAAYHIASGLCLSPAPTDEQIRVDHGGKVAVHRHSFGRHRNVWGFATPEPLAVEEKTVPAWRVSRIGIPSIGYPMEYWMNPHGALMRTAALTGDSFLRDIARSGMVGRFGNYPGDNRSNISLMPELHDAVERRPWEWNFATVNPGHAWDFIGAVVDFLVNDACERSNGNIRFPVLGAGGSLFRVNIYGGEPGVFYGDDNVNLWIPRGLVQSDNPQFDWIAGYGNGHFYLALCNQSPQVESAVLQLNPALVEMAEGSKAKVWYNNQEGRPISVSGNRLNIKCLPRGLVAFAVPARVKPRLQAKLNDSSSPALGPDSFCTVKAPFGTVHASLMRAGRDLTRAYVYTDAVPEDVILARLRWRQGEGEWQEMLDDIFPYEFSPHLQDGAGGFVCVLEVENARQQVLSSGVIPLSMDNEPLKVTGLSLPDKPFPPIAEMPAKKTTALSSGFSDDFVQYIKVASNQTAYGQRNDGRYVPYSTAEGRRIGARQKVWDKALYDKGCTAKEADRRLHADLARSQLELTAFLAARSVEFSDLSKRQQETLLDFVYTEGLSGLSLDLVDAVLSNDWNRMVAEHLYVRYAAHAPDHMRNVAFARRWNIK